MLYFQIERAGQTEKIKCIKYDETLADIFVMEKIHFLSHSTPNAPASEKKLCFKKKKKS